MPRRVKRILDLEDFSALQEMQGTLRDVPLQFWVYFTSGLLRYLKQNTPRDRGLELIQNLRVIAWICAELAKTRGVDVAGQVLADSVADYKLLRLRASWCCQPFVLLCQREALRLRLTSGHSSHPSQRNRTLALQSFRTETQQMLAIVHGLAGSPHLHRATSGVPDDATLESWFGEYSGKKQNMARFITALLTHYHGTTHHVMRRRVSSSMALLDRVLRPLWGKEPLPSKPITPKEMLLFGQQLSS